MKSDLISALAAAEHPLLELEAQDGSLLILPYGARVLGLFSSSGENFFWVNPSLTATASSKAFFSSTGWKNSGGDRTWVAPETDLFIKNIDDPWNTYEVPSSIDPGNYTVQKVDEQVKMINQARVVFHNLKKECEIELEKTIRPVVNPLHREKEAKKLLGQLEYIGYEQVTTLRLISPPLPTPGPSQEGRGVRLGIWNLIQLPAGGHIIIPTVKESYPHDYFEKTGPSHLRVTPRFIHFLLDANERHKIGVQAISTIGRMGYLRSLESGIRTLVVRNFLINPSGEYVDTPWDNRSDLGYAIQCYNDDGHLGKFGEMEYHAPAIGEGTGMTTYQDRSQVWAFLGKEQAINAVCQYLLGAEIGINKSVDDVCALDSAMMICLCVVLIQLIMRLKSVVDEHKAQNIMSLNSEEMSTTHKTEYKGQSICLCVVLINAVMRLKSLMDEHKAQSIMRLKSSVDEYKAHKD